MAPITITLEIDSDFDDSEVIAILDKFGLVLMEPKTTYQEWVRRGENLTVTRFSKKILIQGKETDTNVHILNELSTISSLNFGENERDDMKLFEFSHNALHCMECKHPSVMLINGLIEGSNFIFRQECGHESRMKPPFLVYTSRILPDISVLVAGYISKCIKFGYFENFEILIPDFIVQSSDIFIGPAQKKGVSREINNLRELKNQNKIDITLYEDGYKIPKSQEEFESIEDNIILEIAKVTNSVLFTGDENLKIKSTLNNRPTIFIHPKHSNTIKSISERI